MLTLQFGSIEVVAAQTSTLLPFSNVVDDDSLLNTELIEKVSWSNILLPADADSVVLTALAYGYGAGQLRANTQAPLQIALKFSRTAAGATPTTRILASISDLAESRQKLRVALPAQAWRGQAINLEPVFANFDLNKCRGALVHVYEIGDSEVGKNTESPATSLGRAAQDFDLSSYPNPFNPVTQIHFTLPEENLVAIRIYNLQGQMVRELLQASRPAGEHALPWDGRDQKGMAVASGVYFIHLQAGNIVKSQKLTLMR